MTIIFSLDLIKTSIFEKTSLNACCGVNYNALHIRTSKRCMHSLNDLNGFSAKILLLLSSIHKSIGLANFFNFQFLTDLHVLESPEHDLNIFRKCLSACL